MTNLDSKIRFALTGSLVDNISNEIPNFTRSSPTYLEMIANGNFSLYPVEAQRPAFFPDTGAFVIEPSTHNLLTHNVAIDHNVWVKGSNVQVRKDIALAPDDSRQAERITWTGTGEGLSQSLRRTIKLPVETEYTLSVIIKLDGGSFTENDFIRITGDTFEDNSISLKTFNNHRGRWQLAEFNFLTGGDRPKLPASSEPAEILTFNVTAVGGQTVTIESAKLAGVIRHQFTGGIVAFNNVNEKTYRIVDNTAVSGSSVVLTVFETTLVADGVTTASKAIIEDPPLQDVIVEVYSESVASIFWGGIQLEERSFRTPMIYQGEVAEIKSQTECFFRTSPIATLKTFGVLVDLLYWRGEGRIFDFGNFSARFDDKKLIVRIGETRLEGMYSIQEGEPLRFFVQVVNENSTASLYVNNRLVAQKATANFQADRAVFTLTSEGVRYFKQFIITDKLLLDGQPAMGAEASQDVGQLFRDDYLISADKLATHSRVMILPPVLIPAPNAPQANSRVSGTPNYVNHTVPVETTAQFEINKSVTIVRNSNQVGIRNLLAIATNQFTLDSAAGILAGDRIVQGNVDIPSRVSVRFPVEPIDSQIIRTVDIANKRLTLDTVLSFSPGRAFIRTESYQDIAEIKILDKNDIERWVLVDAVQGLAVGHTIEQPGTELRIEPYNYFVDFYQTRPGVRVAAKSINGIILESSSSQDEIVRPLIIANL